MPSIHVVLDCASPTREPDRLFHALVHVNDDALAAGEHLRRACRHAAIRGFPGPHRVVAVWNAVTGSAIASGLRAPNLEVSPDPRRLRERLEAVMDDTARIPADIARRGRRATGVRHV